MSAMQRGEVEGICNTYSQIAAHADLIREGKITILFHTEETPLAGRPQTPSIYDYAKTEEQAQLVRFVFSKVEFGRPYVLRRVSRPIHPCDADRVQGGTRRS